MGNRIKYKMQENRDNTMISINEYISQRTGARYRIVLDLNTMQYKIRNERTKEFIAKSDSYGNLNVLKRNARARLEELGVQLKKESRDRTFGVCEKGYTQHTHEMLKNLNKE